MKTTEDKIEEIENNGYSLNMDSLITKIFENYKKIAITAGSGLLLVSVVMAGFLLGIIKVSIGFETFNEGIKSFNFAYLSGSALIIYLITIVIIYACTAPLIAGIFKLIHHIETNKTYSFSLLFNYYKNKYFKDIILVTIIITTFQFCLTSLIEMSGIPIIGTILSYFIRVCTSLVLPLIIFGNLTAIQAIQGSFTIVIKQFRIILLLMLISKLLSMVGIIVFFIGIFFTIPIIYSTQYMIYSNTIGFEIRNPSVSNE